MPVSKAMEPKTASKNGKSGKSGKNGAANSAVKSALLKKPSGKQQKIMYPKPLAKVHEGSDAITYKKAKELIGWLEETDKVKFNEEYLFKLGDKKIRTLFNLKNRDFQMSNAILVMQEVLRGKWKLNGETLIIGKYGNVLSAQHRLIGFIMAVEEWRANPDKYPYWKTEPVLESFVSYGVEEDDDTVNTIDTGRPRTLDDVIFRSSYFSKVKTSERKVLARAMRFAIQFLWERTGANRNADFQNLKRTHAESLDFLERHPRVLDCVKHLISEENCHGLVQSPGTAAGLMYLMAVSNSNMDQYQTASPPNEKVLDFRHWEKAENFFVELGGRGKLKAVKAAYVEAKGENRNRLDHYEVIALLIKAWSHWVKNDSPTPKDLSLRYIDNAEDKILDDFPTVGGIDLGKEEYDPVVEPDEVQEEETELTEEEIAKEARRMKMANLRKAQEQKTGKKPTGPLSQGESIWVVESDVNSSWKGTITAPIKHGKALVKIAQGFAGAGRVMEVDAEKLQREQPLPQ